jgi:hypothetical protein
MKCIVCEDCGWVSAGVYRMMGAEMYYYLIGLAFLGAVLSAAGGWGASYVARTSAEADAAVATARLESDKAELNAKLEKFETALNQNTEPVFRAMNIKRETWLAVAIDSVPPGVTDYILLLFKSDRGRISGRVRVKGSQVETSFSTTVNDTIPVSVRNLWVPDQKQYQVPTVIEFAVTETTDAGAALTILTKGWIDSRGREPH